MKKILQKIWMALRLCLKSVRVKQEYNYLKNLRNSHLHRDKYFNGPICELPYKADTPENFVNAVNEFMAAANGFKNFKIKNVKTINVFTPDDQKFIATIYAITQPYGIFYIEISTRKIFFKFSEDIKNKLIPTKYFRIYSDDLNSSNKELKIFYLCLLKRGTVKVYNIYKEWRNENGDYESKIFKTSDEIKFPIKYTDILL